MDKIRENSELIAANGEVIRIDEEDPVLPIQVVKDSIRRKYEVAVAQMDINMCHTVARLSQLRNRASQLNREDGPVHKINRVVRDRPTFLFALVTSFIHWTHIFWSFFLIILNNIRLVPWSVSKEI